MPDIVTFKGEVNAWADDLKVKPREIHVRAMSRKWASCSSKGRVTFSYELVEKPVEFRSKVIVHELLHLRYPSHTKMFKSLLVAYLAKRGIHADAVAVG